MKKILGVDIGTNSIGWALIKQDFERKTGKIIDMGSRIIPMTESELGDFDKGVTKSQVAERTTFRLKRRQYQRHILRRERLHRVLNILGFLPAHYADSIDFDEHLGQFINGKEVKLNYCKNVNGRYSFIFLKSYVEMTNDFEKAQPTLLFDSTNTKQKKIPYDWTIYYLRKKALKEKISKNEMAWIIMNFNSKRGYYQQREEENEVDSKKSKSYEVLTVKKIVETSETTKEKGEKLHEIYFSNGWKYDKKITKPDLWKNKTEEFIVTTSRDKDGNCKRSYRSVKAEEDWYAIKTKTEQEINKSGKELGELIYEKLLENPSQKIRGKLIQTIDREFYKKELLAILTEQAKYHPEIHNQDLYSRCLDELYRRNEAHKNHIKDKNLIYLLIEDIIFHQRPLKSKKSTIGECQYESRYYKDTETGESMQVPLKGIPKSHPLFQEFRLWQFLKNLRIYNKKMQDVTSKLMKEEHHWVMLFDFLNTKKEVGIKQLIQFLISKKLIEKAEKDSYSWNYVMEKKYPANETRSRFIDKLKKVKGVEARKFLTPENQEHLWHIIYSVRDKNAYEKALKTFARKHKINVDFFVEQFKNFPPFKSDYAAYSKKALDKLVPLMRLGKYWDETLLPAEAKNLILSTMERVNDIKDTKDDKCLEKEYLRLADDNIPKEMLKSFYGFKGKKDFLSGLNTYQACYAVYGRHSGGKQIAKWNTTNDIDEYLFKFKQHSLRNPIVEQVVLETLRTVRDIWKFYGNPKERLFDEIHLELGRELKNSAEVRKKISNRTIQNEITNNRIKTLLSELKSDPTIEGEIKPHSFSHQERLKIFEEGVYQNTTNPTDDIKRIRKNSFPTKGEISKYKLWLEQGYKSPYTAQTIPLSKLFTTAYQVEHIIPQSRYFDDSLSNKVISESVINPYPYKDNQTAYEFIKNQGGRTIAEISGKGKKVKLLTLEAYTLHCEKYFKNNKQKLKNLLSEDIPESFISRQLNDTRYISKFAKNVLSNIVRNEDEREATSKNLLPVSGGITNKLKNDWGLNDVWNNIISPRFKRLNDLTQSTEFGSMHEQMIDSKPSGKKYFRITVPEYIDKSLSKKRLDHRHHALDALVIACCTSDHINYITALNTQRNNYYLVKKLRRTEEIQLVNKNGEINRRTIAKEYFKPWDSFTYDAQKALEKIVVSFKQNLRVINKTNNRIWKWKKIKGQYKKRKVAQTKGDNLAIRKSLHREIFYSKVGKTETATRKSLSEIKNIKHLKKVTDVQIREVILPNHLKNYVDANGNTDFKVAFSPEGIETLNKNIRELNNDKPHQPIYKVSRKEESSRFPISKNKNSSKSKKYVEANKGTNLYFAIYWDSKNNKRKFDTLSLNEVVEHQKQMAKLPKKERTPFPLKVEKGTFIFSLSPNDLVYVPTNEEIEKPHLVDLNNLSKNQMERIYLFKDSSKTTANFVPMYSATTVFNINKTEQKRLGITLPIQNEFGLGSAMSKSQNSLDGLQIKSRCWKLVVDRVGNIIQMLP